MIDLPYEKRFTLIYKDGRRVPCVVAINQPIKEDDGLYHATVECRHVFPSGFRRQEATPRGCVAGLFQCLRDVLRAMEFSCEDQEGRPFEFPSGNEIDPDHPSEEEMTAALERLRAQAKDPD